LQCAGNQAEIEGNDHSGHDRCHHMSHRTLAYRPIFVRSALKQISGTSSKRQLKAEYYQTGDQQFART
jgi:hypothetical protein